jgi:TolB-like protein/DNA-binding winged helix-turn-helix (wHTH) protein
MCGEHAEILIERRHRGETSPNSRRCSWGADMERVPPVDLGAAGRVALAGHVIDLQHRELLDAAGRQVDLRKQALDVLLELAARAGHVVGKDELLARVWPGVIVTEDSLVQAISDLRRALGDPGHEVVRTVPRRGYLLALPAADSAPMGAPATHEPGAGSRHEPSALAPVFEPAPSGASASPSAGAARHSRWLLGALATLVAAALIGWVVQRRPDAAAAGPPQIAVLAFHERGHGVEAASLGAGLSEDLVMELGRNQGLSVVANHSSFAVSGKGLSAAELGRQLRAQYLIDGVVQRDGERLDLEVQLIDVRADKVLWASRHRTEGGQVAQARDEIVRKVAGTLFSKMRESEKQRAVRDPPKSLDVYAWTQRGLALKHQFAPAATREARAGLERALRQDPQYAAAWWVLGWLNAVDAHMGITGEWSDARMPEAIAQINRGIELDPHSSTAHQALAVAYGTPNHHEESLAAAQRAVELGPGDAEAWLFQAWAMMPLREPALALASVERAWEMNPLPPTYFQATYAQVLWTNGRLDDAFREAQACNRKVPIYGQCAFVQMIVLAQRGDLEGARGHLAVVQRGGGGQREWCGGVAGSREVKATCHKLASAVGLAE